MTTKLMDLPAGPWIVGAVGLAIIGDRHRARHPGLDREVQGAPDRRGQERRHRDGVRLVRQDRLRAKGIAIGIVGGLFVYAAVTHDPKKSGGLDQALQQVLEQPFGPCLLGADRGRDRLLRAVLLRPGPAPVAAERRLYRAHSSRRATAGAGWAP